MGELSTFSLVPDDVVSIVDSFSRHISHITGKVRWQFSVPISIIAPALSEGIIVCGHDVPGSEGNEYGFSIYEYNGHNTDSKIFSPARIKTKPFLLVPNSRILPDVVVMGGQIFIFEEEDFEMSKVCVFDRHGILNSSFEIEETKQKWPRIDMFRGFNNFLWILKEIDIKTTCLRKYSTSGQLVSTFYIDFYFQCYCIDSNNHLFVAYDDEYFHEYNLGIYDDNANPHNIIHIGPPFRRYKNVSQQIMKLIYNPIAKSLIFYGRNEDGKIGVYETTLKDEKTRTIFPHLYKFGYPVSISTNGSMVLFGFGQVTCVE